MVAQLREIKLKEAAQKIEDGVGETLTYCDFPCEHWARIRTNNVIERLNREIRRRTCPRGGHLPGWELRSHAGLRQASSCGRNPVGQQEVLEHETSGLCLWPGRPCWLTVFNSEICGPFCA